jgi:hypothetical protein
MPLRVAATTFATSASIDACSASISPSVFKPTTCSCCVFCFPHPHLAYCMLLLFEQSNADAFWLLSKCRTADCHCSRRLVVVGSLLLDARLLERDDALPVAHRALFSARKGEGRSPPRFVFTCMCARLSRQEPEVSFARQGSLQLYTSTPATKVRKRGPRNNSAPAPPLTSVVGAGG